MVAAMSNAAIRAAYERDGYLLERNVLSAADLDPVRELLAGQVDEYARRMHAEGKIDSLFEDEPFTRRFAAICAAMNSSPRGWIGNTLDKAYFDLFRHPGVVRVLGEILGPEVTLADDGWTHDLLESRSVSIYSGTSEIQKNIIVGRLLGIR